MAVIIKLEVGQYRFARHGELLAVIWHDRRDLTLLTTAHSHSACTVMKQPKGSREKKVPVTFPTCVVDIHGRGGFKYYSALAITLLLTEKL